MPDPYGVKIPAKVPDSNGAPDDMQDDPVLSILTSVSQTTDSGPYGVKIPANSASNAPADDPYMTSQNASRPNGAPSTMVAMPVSTRPRDFDRQPNINNASPTGQARILASKQGRYDGEDKLNVKYINDLKTRRQKYQVELGSTMSAAAWSSTPRRSSSTSRTRSRARGIGGPRGGQEGDSRSQTPAEWNDAALLWVCAPDPEDDNRCSIPTSASRIVSITARWSMAAM